MKLLHPELLPQQKHMLLLNVLGYENEPAPIPEMSQNETAQQRMVVFIIFY